MMVVVIVLMIMMMIMKAAVMMMMIIHDDDHLMMKMDVDNDVDDIDVYGPSLAHHLLLFVCVTARRPSQSLSRVSAFDWDSSAMQQRLTMPSKPLPPVVLVCSRVLQVPHPPPPAARVRLAVP